MTHDLVQVSIAIPSEVAGTVSGKLNTAEQSPGVHPKSRPSKPLKTGPWLAVMAIVGALIYGWNLSKDSPITAESGLGYYLGIIGGSLMLLLLFYPLRKRVRAMRNWGPVKWWFRTHMTFGLLGPLLVLYHANFSLGSLNSSMALISMLTVAASGIIGRFIYTKIHFGLYGKRATLHELQHETSQLRRQLNLYLKLIPPLHESVLELEETALRKPQNIAEGFIRLFTLSIGTLRQRMVMRSQLRRGLAIIAHYQQWDIHQRRVHYRRGHIYLTTYLKLIIKTGNLSFYEQIFSMWHVLHLPLFVMLVITGIAHVVAVHAY